MKITEINVHILSTDTIDHFKADASQDACIIEVKTDEGITGIGEADSSPAVVQAIVNAPVSHDKSSGLGTIIHGRDPFDVEVLWNEMFDRSYYYGRRGAAITAISGIDMALWDIIGRKTGHPIHKLLGGKHVDSVRAYASTLFPDDPANTEHIRAEIDQAIEMGFTAIKFGWGGFGKNKARDLELIRVARETLGPDVDIMVDAGLAWRHDLKRAIKETNELDRKYDIYWMEEPIGADNLEGYSKISKACETRIVGGEEEYTVYGFDEFIRRGNPDGVQPDVARSGGITHMEKIATLASTKGIPILPHGYSTDLLIAANLQIIAANQNAPLLEYCMEDSPIRWDLVDEDFSLVDGHVDIPDRPGLGITLNRDTLEKYSVDTHVIA